MALRGVSPWKTVQGRGGHLGANGPTVALKCFFVALKRLLSIFKS